MSKPILRDSLPMTEHVVTTYTVAMQRMERRSGRSLAKGRSRLASADPQRVTDL
ncbi:hypothetical protein [Bradyrhizobium sp. STM 3843]|uniref:hypothetical protein n=1 Tax=Bradyrhizobium sp. STM 3843 TaxID=551947 RepID=UPI0002F5FF9D|nr:hypothetical protein [Bradyrhizobium sp. STM 3843]